MSDAVFGPLVTADEVEAAVVETLKTWAPTYFAWVERHRGLAPRTLLVPRFYVSSNDQLERWPEEHPGSVLVVCPGLSGDPQKEGSGIFTAHYGLGIAYIAEGRNRGEARARAQLSTAALRMVLLQHQTLGGIADGILWTDEDWDNLPRSRTLAAGKAEFTVIVRETAAIRSGPVAPAPLDPPSAPYTPQPDPTVVSGGTITLTPEPLE